MPAPIFYAHKILRLISEARTPASEKVLGPDSKSQVTVQYVNGKPVGVREIVVSHQHLVEDRPRTRCASAVEPYVREALPKGWINSKTIWHINPTGKFVIGGPDGDAASPAARSSSIPTAAAAPHGGGAFSGKDPTKVDRSAAYAARYLAKNVVAAGLPTAAPSSSPTRSASPIRCRSMSIPTAPARSTEKKLEKAAAEVMDLTPRDIRTPSRAQSSDLRAHRVLRPFRPCPGQGGRLLLGKDRPRRAAQARRLTFSVIVLAYSGKHSRFSEYRFLSGSTA